MTDWQDLFEGAWVALQDIADALAGVEADMDDGDFRSARDMLAVAQQDLGDAIRQLEAQMPATAPQEERA